MVAGGGNTLLWFELASVAQLNGGFGISEAANKIMCVLRQQGALLLFPGPYGRLGGFRPIYATYSSFFPVEIIAPLPLHPFYPKISYKEQNARCIVPD